MPASRLIMYHKQSTSARTRFLRLAHGGVCGFAALPADASLAEVGRDSGRSAAQPVPLPRDAETRLGLPSGSLEIEPGYRCLVTSPEEGATEVLLARFTSIDPPFEEVAAHDCAFIDLTQARHLPAIELALLRLAYERILG